MVLIMCLCETLISSAVILALQPVTPNQQLMINSATKALQHVIKSGVSKIFGWQLLQRKYTYTHTHIFNTFLNTSLSSKSQIHHFVADI